MGGLTEQGVRAALQGVIDPELGTNVIDLGMVKQIDITDGYVTVRLVLTAPGCPLADWIVLQAQRAVAALPGVARVLVDLLDEPWQPPGATEDWQSWVNSALGRR